jgi:hypothetical protein
MKIEMYLALIKRKKLYVTVKNQNVSNYTVNVLLIKNYVLMNAIVVTALTMKTI